MRHFGRGTSINEALGGGTSINEALWLGFPYEATPLDEALSSGASMKPLPLQIFTPWQGNLNK